jgi:hypothetical protein
MAFRVLAAAALSVGLARAVIFTDSGNGCFCATTRSANSTGAAFANATLGCRDWNGATK